MNFLCQRIDIINKCLPFQDAWFHEVSWVSYVLLETLDFEDLNLAQKLPEADFLGFLKKRTFIGYEIWPRNTWQDTLLHQITYFHIKKIYNYIQHWSKELYWYYWYYLIDIFMIFDLYYISCTDVKPMNCMVLGNKQYNAQYNWEFCDIPSLRWYLKYFY